MGRSVATVEVESTHIIDTTQGRLLAHNRIGLMRPGWQLLTA